MRNKSFKILLLLTALIVAGVAAYFSVYGLSKLFAGALLATIIMASSLEIGKLILSSYLYRVWNNISKVRRFYGVLAVAILMLITSVGIYGFLSNAFEKTSIRVEQIDSQVEIIDTRILSKEQERDRYQQLITDKQNRIVTLTELRKQQEVRLDSLLSNEHWFNATKTNNSIENADKEIQKLYGEIDDLSVKIDSSNNQIVILKTNKLEYKSDVDITGEIGPLKYISRLTGRTMDKVVNWIILLLIFVFDPLAIYLILSYNHLELFKEIKNKKEENIISEKTDSISIPIPINPLIEKETDVTYIPIDDHLLESSDKEIRKILNKKYKQIIKEKENKKGENKKIENIENIENDKVENLIKNEKKIRKTRMDDKTGGICYYEETIPKK